MLNIFLVHENIKIRAQKLLITHNWISWGQLLQSCPHGRNLHFHIGNQAEATSVLSTLWFKLDQKSRHQSLRVYCSIIYCEQRHKTTKRNSKHTNFNLQLHSLIYRLDRQSCRSINQNLFIHCLYIYSTDNLRSYVWEIDFSKVASKVASKVQKFGNYKYTYQNSIYFVFSTFTVVPVMQVGRCRF